jgi:hypothetical protein
MKNFSDAISDSQTRPRLDQIRLRNNADTARIRDLFNRQDLTAEEVQNVDNADFFKENYGRHHERAQFLAAERNRGMQGRQRETDVKNFEASIPGYQQQAYTAVEGDERRRLAEEMTGINRSMNRRGLLYSGMNEGAQRKAQSQSAGMLGQARQDINKSFQDQAEQMRDNAIGTGMGIQQNLQAASDMAYRQAVASMMQRRGAIGAIGGAVGTGVGMYLGGPMGAAAGGQLGGMVG